jgi:hypothetical protein
MVKTKEIGQPGFADDVAITGVKYVVVFKGNGRETRGHMLTMSDLPVGYPVRPSPTQAVNR